MRSLVFICLAALGPTLFGQHQDKVDFIKANIVLNPEPLTKSLQSTVRYKFTVTASVDTIFLDAKNMEFSTVLLDNDDVKYVYDNEKITVYHSFRKGSTYNLTIAYKAQPKQTVYFLGWDDAVIGNEQIWTQGQGKYTSHWLPSLDAMQEKLVFHLTLVFDSDYSVIANGKLNSKETSNGLTEWRYTMQRPMSSYLLAFAIGKYNKQELVSNTGVPIENYYYPYDSLKVEPTFRYTQRIFNFLEKEIGVPYPWQNYKQIPVRDFLYAGMENTAATIFSDGYVVDSIAFADRNYVNVNAHELAHQWFGNLVTEQSGSHHWLHEGFATYYAYLAEKEIFGEDHFYWKLYTSLQQLKSISDKGQGQSLLNAKASSLTFYEKGAWALYMLNTTLGNEKFKEGIKRYLTTYQFRNVTVSNFLDAMEVSSGIDLSKYRKDWLENKEIPWKAAKAQLQKHSASLKSLFALEESMAQKELEPDNFNLYWDTTTSVHLRKHLIETYFDKLPPQIFNKAFASDTVVLRQSVAKHLDATSDVLQTAFESLLDDRSYNTREIALLKLWSNYPSKRSVYLSNMEDNMGLANTNIRLLWLTLAILTPDYKPDNAQMYYNELVRYTSKLYGWELRIGAFNYLHEALGFSDEALLHLMNATVHHSWQFKKYARNLTTILLKDTAYTQRIKNLRQKLSGEELRYISAKLNKE